MKALSIHQPFASLIASGEKWVENRRWGTDYRGPLVIHASKRSRYLSDAELATLPCGVLLAVVDLVACESLEALGYQDAGGYLADERTVGQVLAHDHTEGPVCWVLARPRPLSEPVPYRGAQGLFEVPDDLVHKP